MLPCLLYNGVTVDIGQQTEAKAVTAGRVCETEQRRTRNRLVRSTSATTVIGTEVVKQFLFCRLCFKWAFKMKISSWMVDWYQTIISPINCERRLRCMKAVPHASVQLVVGNAAPKLRLGVCHRMQFAHIRRHLGDIVQICRRWRRRCKLWSALSKRLEVTSE